MNSLWLQLLNPKDFVNLYGTAVDVPAFGGRFDVDWSPRERVTSVGGLVYFATILKETGLIDRLCEDFSIAYKSNNSSLKCDIIGTTVLAILFAKSRYLQIKLFRYDRTARELIGLRKFVSYATIQRAFKHANKVELDAWFSRHEREVYEVLLAHPYIIDIDNTVKPISGIKKVRNSVESNNKARTLQSQLPFFLHQQGSTLRLAWTFGLVNSTSTYSK